MKSTDTAALLEEAADYFEKHPECWLQGILSGFHLEGARVKSTMVFSSEANSFCAQGILNRFGYTKPGEPSSGAFRYTEATITEALGEVSQLVGGSVVSFNDKKGRRVQEVIAIFRRAASNVRLRQAIAI